MNNLVDSLKTRYDAVFASTSDREFYQNVHHYFDLIHKTPSLNKIFEDSENDYRTRHIAVNDDKSLTYEEHAELVARVERFSLWANAAYLLARVYDPLEDYKNSLEPEDRQDPMALLMMKGIKGIHTKKWSRENLKTYNRWYDGQRPRYETDLRQTHLMLLSEIEKKGSEAIVPEKKEAAHYFNPATGEFHYDTAQTVFNPSTQAYKVMTKLLSTPNMSATHLELWRSLYPGATEVTKTQKGKLSLIVRNIKKSLGILPKTATSCPDFIKSMPMSGSTG